MSKAIKKTAKKAWKAVKKYTGDRYGRGSEELVSKGIPQMMKDINMLKSIINSEKLRVTQRNTTTQTVGQFNGNSAGFWSLDVTPTPAQGDGTGGRTGSSIKIHASHFSFQLSQMTGCAQEVKLRMYLLKVVGPTANYTTAPSNLFNEGMYAGIPDIHSSLRPAYTANFRVLRRKDVVIKADSFSGNQTPKPFDFGIKYNKGQGHHVRWVEDTTNYQHGQLLLVILADCGNMSAVTANTTTPAPPITVINSGIQFNYKFDHYYYDN